MSRSLSESGIKALPEGCCDAWAGSLTSLAFQSNNTMRELPADLSLLTSLQEMRGDWAALEALPPTFGQLHDLRSLCACINTAYIVCTVWCMKMSAVEQ